MSYARGTNHLCQSSPAHAQRQYHWPPQAFHHSYHRQSLRHSRAMTQTLYQPLARFPISDQFRPRCLLPMSQSLSARQQASYSHAQLAQVNQWRKFQHQPSHQQSPLSLLVLRIDRCPRVRKVGAWLQPQTRCQVQQACAQVQSSLSQWPWRQHLACRLAHKFHGRRQDAWQQQQPDLACLGRAVSQRQCAAHLRQMR